MAHPNDFKDEACEILMGQGQMSDLAYQTALGFIPNMRMKKWKPRQGTDSNKTFCYMNIDSTKDYWFTFPNERACSMGLFGDTPIIKQVFSNAELDNTSSFPFNKCVFEVDAKQVNDNVLSTFWSNVDQIDCASLYAGYQYSNAILQNEIAEMTQIENSCNVYLQQLDQNLVHLSNVVVSCNAQIESLEERIYNLNQQDKGILQNLYVTKNSIDIITTQYASYRHDAEIVINAWTHSNAVMVNNVQAATTYDNQMIAANTKLTKQLGDLWGTYTTDVAYMTTLSNEFLTIYKQNQQYVAWNASLTGSLNSCHASINSLNGSISDYTNRYNQEKVNNTNLNNSLTSITNQLNLCQSQLNQCTTTQAGLITQNDQLIVRYQQCEDALSKCMAIQQGLISQSNQLGIAIVNWLHTYVRCDDVIHSISSIQTQITSANNTCRISDQAIYDKLLADTQNIITQSTADSVTACTSDVNSININLPPPQPLPLNAPPFPPVHPPPDQIGVRLFGAGNFGGDDWITGWRGPGRYTAGDLGLPNGGTSSMQVKGVMVTCYEGNDLNGNNLGTWTSDVASFPVDNTCHSIDVVLNTDIATMNLA